MAVTDQRAVLTNGEEVTAFRRQHSLWSDAFYRLRQNKMAMVALIVIIALCVIAVFAPIIAPHNPTTLM
ncbi:MAG: ABC transporter permease, partial [Chloroflexi bacterium]|nr:ABC transporter permease [Chloroflexota bacterium]